MKTFNNSLKSKSVKRTNKQTHRWSHNDLPPVSGSPNFAFQTLSEEILSSEGSIRMSSASSPSEKKITLILNSIHISSVCMD